MAHRAGSGVARVDKGFLAFFSGGNALALAFVQRLKISPAHKHLAAHFQHPRHRNRRAIAAVQAQRYLADGADVLRHVFAVFTVTTRSGLLQTAVDVAQVDGQTVEFEFGHIFHRRGIGGQLQFLAHPRIKSLCAAGGGIGFGADAEHRHGVAHAGKLLQRLATHALGGRIGAMPLRVRGFECLQFGKQAVVFGIGQRGGVHNVILVRQRVQLRAQAFQALPLRRVFGDEGKQIRLGHGWQPCWVKAGRSASGGVQAGFQVVAKQR